MAIAGASLKAALRLTNNSGAEVANETMVIPMSTLDRLNLKDKATEDLTRYSPPTTNKTNPKISQTMLMKSIFMRIYYLSRSYVNAKTHFLIFHNKN